MPDIKLKQPWRLLHVEDSQIDAELIVEHLRRDAPDCEVTRVETEEAFVAALEDEPDAIICDYRLPRFSAERAMALVQGRGLMTPFVIVSHHLGETAAVVAMQNGASDYLPKGDLGRLGKAIEAAIDRVQARRARAAAVEALRRSEALTRGVLDSLLARIVVVDGTGRILAANRVWSQAMDDECGGQVGDNYLEILGRAARSGNAFAAEGLNALKRVIRRETAAASLDYHFPMPGGRRWFVARATPLEGTADGAVVSHQDVTDRMMAHAALDAANRRLQGLSRKVLDVQEEERRNISRELHDDFGQSLTALKIGLHRAAQDPGPAQRERLQECVELADSLLEKIRNLAQDIRPPQLDQLGLAEALEALARRHRGATGLDIRCEYGGDADRRFPSAVESSCYRIAQEALSNASRHGRPGQVRIRLEARGNLLRLSVHDDGVGFDARNDRAAMARAGSMGLIGMEERAELAGGRLKVRSVRGAGTTVSAVFPLVPGAYMEAA